MGIGNPPPPLSLMYSVGPDGKIIEATNIVMIISYPTQAQ